MVNKSIVLAFLEENSIEGEIWKEFKYGNPKTKSMYNWYVSNMGRIAKDFKISLGCKKSDGYMRLGNMKGVHNVVAEAFIPKTKEDLFLNRLYVDHKNGKRDDNRVSNLRWCTISENNTFELARLNNSKAKLGSLNHMYGKKPTNTGKVIYNNGRISKYFVEGTQPKDFVKGRLINA